MDQTAQPRLSQRKMHDGKKVLGFSEAQKLARLMTSKWSGTFNAYRCQWNDDGTWTSVDQAHWHTGKARGGTVTRELTDWECEIPERSKWA